MTNEVQSDRAAGLAREARRWVSSPGRRVPRTRHGLVDGEMLSHEWYLGDRPFRSERLVDVRESYVLLAPGGAGKTTLVERLKGAEPQSGSVDLRMCGRESLPSAIRSVSASARAVFVDALDEALQFDPNLGYMLVKLLSEAGARGVAWRLACRPGSWTLDLASGLKEALPEFQEFELLPLDLDGVAEIAGDDAQAFLAAVDHARLTRQLALPLNARALLEQWRSTGQLPATRAEAMRHSVGRLLEEAGAFRRPRGQDDKRMLIGAERLAAIAMFCGVGRFALGSAVGGPLSTAGNPGVGSDATNDGAVIAVTSVPVDEEPDLVGARLSVDDVREVLGASLFSAAGAGSVAFLHQSYAEYLAAAFLRRRGVGGTRLQSLLGSETNGLVPGPMIEVLGWMLALGAQVPAELIADNAKPLLRTAGLELADQRNRERLVDALLRGAANGSIDEGWSVDTSVLAHPGLGAQLHDASHHAVNPWEIFWITRIARHCVVLEAADDLLAIARDPSWPAFVRAEALESFVAVAPVDRLGELDPLLELDAGEDPDDEIHAAALRAQFQGTADVQRIAAVLRPRRTPSFIGGYARLLDELPNLIRSTDALPLLKAALTWQSEIEDGAFGRLATGLISRAWEMPDAAALNELGGLIGRERSLGATARSGSLPWETDDRPELRRAVASAALATGGQSYFPVLRLRILTVGDVAWLIDWMEEAPAEALDSALVLLRNLAWDVADAETANRILEVSETHPAYAALSKFQGHVGIDARPDWDPPEREGDEHSGRGAHLLELMRDAIAAAQKDLGCWWKTVGALSGAGNGGSFLAWDLTAGPLWTELEPAEQDEFWRLALDYLATRQPEPARWVGRNRWNFDVVMPDWAAVFALATAAAHHPGVLAELSTAVWETWCPIIVAMPPFTEFETWQRLLKRVAPAVAQAAIAASLRELVRSGNSARLAHHPLADYSDTEFLDALVHVARDPRHGLEYRDEALRVLVERAPTAALEVARSLALSEEDPPAGVAEALAALSPEEFLAPRRAAGTLGPLAPLPHVDLDRLSDPDPRVVV